MTVPGPGAAGAARAAGAAGAVSAWAPLLDRLEERLRRIEASAATGPDAGPAVEIGPPPGAEDVPADPPGEDERLRLLALLAAHETLAERLEARKRSLRQAQHYRSMGAA